MGGTIALVPSAIVGCVILSLVFYSKRVRRRKLKLTDAEAYAAHCSGDAGSTYINIDEQSKAALVRKSADNERPNTFYAAEGNVNSDAALLAALRNQNERRDGAKRKIEGKESNDDDDDDDEQEEGRPGGTRDSTHDLSLLESRFPGRFRPRNNSNAGESLNGETGGVQRRPRPGRAHLGSQNNGTGGPSSEQMQMPDEYQHQQPTFPQFVYAQGANAPYGYQMPMMLPDGQFGYPPQMYAQHPYMVNPYTPNGQMMNMQQQQQPQHMDHGENQDLTIFQSDIARFQEFANSAQSRVPRYRRQTMVAPDNNGLLINMNSSEQTHYSQAGRRNDSTHRASTAQRNSVNPPSYEQTLARDGL
ncbi:hypothetical protein LPJ56_001838 [Coemansia sp. RSA 2599]|nr:hypothetical protein LPJ56_001838 [Coemansia sp. RSA 2599]